VIRAGLIVIMMFAAINSRAHGQSPAASPVAAKRELTIDGKPGELDILRKVPAASAFAAVVNEPAGALVVAHAPQPSYAKSLPEHFEITDEPDLTLFRLDAKGEAGAGTPLRLPRAAKLVKRRQYPLALATHPKLPLVYVWQDVVAPAEGAAPDDFAGDGFKHLHIYDVSSPKPKLLQSACGGETFSRGNPAAAIDLDRNAARLFLPNMRRPTKIGFASAIGYMKLGDDGLLADPTPAAEAEAPKLSLFSETPCGLGFHNLSDDITLVCAGLGPATWDEGNRRGQLGVVTFFPAIGVGYRYRMVVHPTIPVVFLTGISTGALFRVEHVDGFLTMWPQRATLADALLTSPPVLVGKRSLLACYGTGKLHLVGFDEAGFLNGERIDIAPSPRKVEALAYSAKYDRLYLTIEEAKK
jgi:hypothetical protein